MAANGISTLSTKEERQIAKLDLAAAKRGENYDRDLLPTRYDGNTVVYTPHPDGLQPHRPWINGTPPPTQLDAGFYGDDAMHNAGGHSGWWVVNGGFSGFSTFSDPAPAWNSVTYVDTTTGHTFDFTGTQWLASMNLSVSGAWQSNTITIDYWFYPTANSIQLLSECNYPDVTSGYHYSVLEINSSGNVKARFYNGTALTSNNSVQLNRWNHIWFTEDSQGGHSFELNGEPTNGNPNYTRIKPSSEYFVIGEYDVTNMGNTGRFRGKVGYLEIHDYVAPSTYSNRASKFRKTYTATFGTDGPPGSAFATWVWPGMLTQDVTGWTITGPDIPQGVTVVSQGVMGSQTTTTFSQDLHYTWVDYTFVAP